MKESKAEFQKALDCMLFEGVDRRWVEPFLHQNGQSHCFARGEEIYSPAHYSKSLGILLRGKAVVEREQVLLNQLSAGECFGAATLLVQREQYVTTVRARTDCKVLFLSLEAMQRLLENPQVSLNYIRFLSDRIQFLNRRIASFTAPNAEQTLLSFLRQQPQQRCEGVSMVKLSEVLNIGRTSLYRVVQQLEQDGVIKREGRVIQLMEEPSISREKRK